MQKNCCIGGNFCFLGSLPEHPLEVVLRIKGIRGETLLQNAERDVLRKEYIADVKRSLVGQLENTTIVRPDGSRQKVTKKNK